MNILKIELGTKTIGVDNALTDCLEKKEFYPTLVVTNEDHTQNCRYVISYDNLVDLFKSLESQVKYAKDNGFNVK